MSKENVMQNQEVSAALDLLISTLSDERNRIYDIGASAMLAKDKKTAQAVIDFAQKLEKFQESVQNLNHDWLTIIAEKISAPEKVQAIVDGEGKLFGMRTRNTPSGFTRKVDHPISPETNFSVSIP
jgi:hypothetical protein